MEKSQLGKEKEKNGKGGEKEADDQLAAMLGIDLLQAELRKK